MRVWVLLAGTSLALACQKDDVDQVQRGDVDREDPRWHFDRIDHQQGDMTLTDVWGRSDGAVFVVGWYGTIFTNRATVANPGGIWTKLESNTTEHLTAIWGVENGRQFRQQRNEDGELWAVGWNGALLHYHPNPTGLTAPVPEDGRWQVIAGPGRGFTPRVKIDPYCPDADGDGVADDGGGALGAPGPDGWWSLADTCRGGNTAACDDNCRESPNGNLRPIVDRNGDFTLPGQNCLEYPEDGPSTSVNPPQDDPDGDGLGTVCDELDGPALTETFQPTLFDVWATLDPADATRVMVVAVGEDGAVVSYVGPNGAQTVAPPALGIDDRGAWIAQPHVSYLYSNDCPLLVGGPTPAGTVCVGAGGAGPGRLPPACAAQCTPYKTTCDCPVAQNQCCVDGNAALLVGAPCHGPGCESFAGSREGLPAENACDAATGACGVICPNCFRRLDKTLRSIASDGTTLVAVGIGGTVVTLGIGGMDPTGVWTLPDCSPNTPPPLDERPLLTAVSPRDGGFHMVGAGGLVGGVVPGSSCGLDTRCGAPPAFMAGVFSIGQQRGYAVGDSGTLVEFGAPSGDCVGAPAVESIVNDTKENLNSIWVTRTQGVARLWMVGAHGAMVRATYY
jgi:hypothetical protein